MENNLKKRIIPNGSTKYVFFGGKGGVGKTTIATTTAVWFADQGYKTTIVSTDPTVSLSVMFDQQVGGEKKVAIRRVPNLCGLNINPVDAKGAYKDRFDNLMGQISSTFGEDVTSTPCTEEMVTFDQFISFLDDPDSDVVVFDTAPTGKTLRELAMPFDWAGFIQNQIKEGKELARFMYMDTASFDALEKDKLRYEKAMSTLQDTDNTVFTLVMLPERLPMEETESAVNGLAQLNIAVQALVINQVILPEVIQGNRFLEARSNVQSHYLKKIDERFPDLLRLCLPLLDRDVSDLSMLRRVGTLLYGK